MRCRPLLYVWCCFERCRPLLFVLVFACFCLFISAQKYCFADTPSVFATNRFHSAAMDLFMMNAEFGTFAEHACTLKLIKGTISARSRIQGCLKDS